MVSVMFDSDQPQVLLQPMFQGCRLATYADLLTPALVGQFGSRLVAIDRGHGDPMKVATVADIEPGCYSVAAGVAVIKSWLAEKRPNVAAYHDRNDWTAVSSGLAGTAAKHWVATLDGTADPGGQRPAAVQLLGADKLGFHADLSIIWDETWHPLPATITASELTQLQHLTTVAQQGLGQLFSYIAHL